MNPNGFDDIIQRMMTGGWDALEGVSSEVRRRVALEDERSADEKRVINAAWARFAASEDGRRALEALFDVTLRRTVFFVNLNLPPDQVLAWGAFREGQNALAHAIARAIAEGQGDDPPKPRETT